MLDIAAAAIIGLSNRPQKGKPMRQE